MMFTQTDIATWMRLARSPAGPTLTFRVHSYSTMRDVVGLQKRPISLEAGKNFTPMVSPLSWNFLTFFSSC
jgi:ribosome biogenesis protein SSF1/2